MRQSIATDALKLTTSKVIPLLISLVSAMVLSRILTLKEYGTYSQLLLIINLLTTIFILGLPNSINYFLASTKNIIDKQRFLSVYYTLSTILSFFIGLILVLSAPLIARYFENPLIKNFIYVLAVFPWAKIILSSIDHVLIIYQKTTYLVFFRIINSVFLLSIILLTKFFNWSFGTYMLLFILIESFFGLSVYIIARNIAGKIKVYFNRNLTKKIFTFSLPIGLATVVGTLTREMDKLVIAGFYNTEKLAIYTNSARELPITFVAVSLTAILMPQIVRLLKENQRFKAIKIWGDTVSLSYFIICYLAIGLFTFAPEAITLLYSEKYITGVPVFKVYTIVLLFRCTYFGIILNSSGNTKIILQSSVIALISNFIFNFVFYFLFGFIGPAIATLLAILFSNAYLLLVTSKIIKIPIKKIFPWKDIICITILNIGFGVFFAIIKNILLLDQKWGEIIESILLGSIWGLLYFAINFRFIRIKWQALNESNHL